MKKASFIIILAALLLVVSCKSYLLGGIDDFTGIIPADNSMFVAMDTASDPELAGFFVNNYVELDDQSVKLFDKAARIYVGLKDSKVKNQGLTGSGKAGTDFDLAAYGDFPKGSVNFAFSTRKSWHKLDTSIKSWENISLGLSISVPSNDLLFASSGNLNDILTNFKSGNKARFPEQVKEIFSQAMLAVYIPEVARDNVSSFQIGSSKQILTELLFYVSGDNSLYHVNIVLTLADQDDVKGFKSILKTYFLGIIRNYGKEELARFRNDSVLETDRNKVLFSGIRLEPENLRDFLEKFLFRDGDRK